MTFIDNAKTKFTQYDTMFKNQDAYIRNFQAKLGHISQQLVERPQSSLPNNTVANPREYVKAITLKSGKELAKPTLQEEKSFTRVEVESQRGNKYEIPIN